MAASRSRRNGATAVLVLGVVAGMVGMSFAAVPLYKMFCQATGYEGTTQRAKAAPGAVGERQITVRFNTDVSPDLPWEFRPVQPSVTVRPGEETLVYFRAINRSNHEIVGSATFNVTPLKTGQYFDKIQCFCFTEQRLAPGQSIDMPVSFFVDPDLVTDPNTREVDTITLSYTMFPAKTPVAEAPAAGAARTSVN
jgi:cytochrome c oxidase assembly protein subunit 11